MHFKIAERKNPNVHKYKNDDFALATKFSAGIKQELGDFVKCVVLFGSAARAERGFQEHDIDVLMVIDDLTKVLSPEVIEAYRIITQSVASRVSKRLHITTLKLTTFWEYVRGGDPLAVNILRDGVPLKDVGIFEPLQMLLFQGKVKPTKESVWSYFARAPLTIKNSEWHVLQATVDLYWACIDAAHAAIMKVGEVPASPAHVADMVREKLVRPKIVPAKYADMMKMFYDLNKRITYRQVERVTGKEYERYRELAEDFVRAMQAVVEGKR
jgi:predicted nucleotidyltransferase